MVEEKIIYGADSCFNLKGYEEPEFGVIGWHKHPEYELVYVEKGRGRKLVGENMFEFQSNDLTLIGPNIPHLFISEPNENSAVGEMCRWWVIQFSPNIFPPVFLETDAFVLIKKLLEASNRGVSFEEEDSKWSVFRNIRKINDSIGLPKLTGLYHLLNQLSNEKNITLMSDGELNKAILAKDTIVDRVYAYLLTNFHRQITLEEISEIVHMRPTTLCSYYKRHTLKSIIETLIEIRLGFACKQLSHSSLTVNQIAYDSGFRNVSNFNRQFLKVKKITPFEYRKRFKELNDE